ncbi:MAG: T9SS type A sorting domain-containing protein [Flavobacteriaceae bacterium]|jgi:uncharacterized membrane protein|nr:T9SS type A sorting domain-containing protein [Flavobacteriaceae bacterium]
MKSICNFYLKILGTLLLCSQMMNAQQVYTVVSGGLYYPGGVTNDGAVSMNRGNEVYYWNPTNGLIQIGTANNGVNLAGKSLISQDGSKIVAGVTNSGTNVNEVSVYDVSTATWTHLGGPGNVLDGSISTPWGMNPDGNIIVGLGWFGAFPHAIKWTPTDGWTDMGSTLPGNGSRANVVNDDGTIIAGWQDNVFLREAVRWVNGVQAYLTDTDGNHINEPSGISADGKTIVGYNDTDLSAYVWNETTGYQAITHPNTSSNFRGGSTAVSADGKTVIGYYRSPFGIPVGGEGFIWTQETGRIELNQYVESLGIDTQGIKFGLPLAISRDGTKIAGAGIQSGVPTTFMIDLSGTMATQNANIKKLSIYPNPVKDVLNITGFNKLENIEIFNMAGQRVKSPATSDKINVSELSKGTYILRLTADGKKQNIKLIKE